MSSGQFRAATIGAWTRAQAQAALEALVFAPTNHQVIPGATVTTVFTIQLDDGGNLASNANTSVIATAINNPPTILDAPEKMAWDAVGLPDPETPVGARGIGEPPVAAGCCSVLNAISAAVGDDVFVRAPVLLDHILTAMETKKPGQRPLTANV